MKYWQSIWVYQISIMIYFILLYFLYVSDTISKNIDVSKYRICITDTVIAIRTRSSKTVSDYSCNDRHVITMTRNPERPIIGSVLQSKSGVAREDRFSSGVIKMCWRTFQLKHEYKSSLERVTNEPHLGSPAGFDLAIDWLIWLKTS
jgi:hypothetical protein